MKSYKKESFSVSVWVCVGGVCGCVSVCGGGVFVFVFHKDNKNVKIEMPTPSPELQSMK